MQQEMAGGCWWLEEGTSTGGRMSWTGLGSDQLGVFPSHQKISFCLYQTKRKFGFLKV